MHKDIQGAYPKSYESSQLWNMVEHVWNPEFSGKETSFQQVPVEHQLIQTIHALQVTAVESSNSKIASAPR